MKLQYVFWVCFVLVMGLIIISGYGENHETQRDKDLAAIEAILRQYVGNNFEAPNSVIDITDHPGAFPWPPEAIVSQWTENGLNISGLPDKSGPEGGIRIIEINGDPAIDISGDANEIIWLTEDTAVWDGNDVRWEMAASNVSICSDGVELIFEPILDANSSPITAVTYELTDDSIRRLVKSGAVCEVMGHQWHYDETWVVLRCKLCATIRSFQLKTETRDQ